MYSRSQWLHAAAWTCAVICLEGRARAQDAPPDPSVAPDPALVSAAQIAPQTEVVPVGVPEEVTAAAPPPEVPTPEVAPIAPEAVPVVEAVPPEPPLPPPWGLDIGGVLFRPSIEVRPRGEIRGGWYRGQPDQGIVTNRARIGLDVKWDVLRAFVQVQDARDFGIYPGLSTEGSIGVHQGFLEIGNGSTYLRAGRQEIDYGGQRLIGSLNWASGARSFDAIRVHGQHETLTLDGFAAFTRTPRNLTGPDGRGVSSEGDYVGGLAVEWAPFAALRLGAFALFRHDGPTEVPAGTAMDQFGQFLDRRRNIGSWSLRANGLVEQRLRYEVELILQAGGVNDADFFAAGAIADLTYIVVEAPFKPEISLGGSVGTGNQPGGNIDEIDNFFPTNHLIYGLADLFGLRNQMHGYVRFGLTPVDRTLSLWAAGRLFRFMEPNARWTDAPGNVLGLNRMNGDDFAGGEIDAEVRWTPIEHVLCWAGYGVFIPGGGAVALGHPEPAHFGYLMLGVSFP